MASLPVFANCSYEEQILQLRHYFRSLGSEISEKNSGSLDKDVEDLIAHCGILAKLESESEAEMVLNSVMTTIVFLPNVDQTRTSSAKFCEKLSNLQVFPTKFGGVIIRVLSNLFHGFGSTPDRRPLQFTVYCNLVKVAGNCGQIRLIPTDLAKLNEWFEQWKIIKEQKRTCLRMLHEALLNNHQSEAPAKVMVELLSTYTEADAEKAKEDAHKSIRSAIADPGTFVFDHLLSLRPVEKLKGEKIYQLLEIFISGSLQDYQKFYTANQPFMEELKLNHQDNMHKMRVLTLMKLGETNHEMDFDTMANALQLPPNEELEEFMIKAIQSKMVQAKIDQMRRKVVIGSVVNRKFDKLQWEQLNRRLQLWSENLQGLKTYLSTIHVEN